MIEGLRLPRTERDILGSASLGSVTPWIIAAMAFAIILVASGGLMIANASRTLERAIESRYTLVIPGGSADASAIADRMRQIAGVSAIEAVSEQDMRRTLGQWLGPAAQSADLPVPALIDFDIASASDLDRVKRDLRRAVPDATLSGHSGNVAPFVRSLHGLQWTALLLVILLAIAAGAAVVLSARSALVSHRATIEVLHGIGATDAQVTRLFVRKIASDTLIGSAVGGIGAAVAILILASSALWLSNLGGLALGIWDIAILCLIPLLLTLSATLAARAAIISTLEREL